MVHWVDWSPVEEIADSAAASSKTAATRHSESRTVSGD